MTTGVTGAAQLTNSILAKQIAARLVRTAYARVILDAIAGAITGGYGEGGSGHDYITGATSRAYPRLGKLAAAAMTEGVDASATQLSDSQVQVTPAECGVGVDLTDTAYASLTPANYKNAIVVLMGKAYGDYVDTEGLKLTTSAAKFVGTDATGLTEDVFLSAINVLDAADAESPLMSILGATACHNLRSRIGGNSANNGPVFMRQDILSRIGPALPSGYVTTLYNVDIFKSTNVPAANTTTDALSMMFTLAPGSFPFVRLIRQFPSGITGAEGVEGVQSVQQDDPALPAGGIWDGRYEEQRDASYRLTEMWVTGAWKWGCLATDWVASILSTK